MKNIPVLSVKGESIPEAWENSVVELHTKGLWYSREGPKDKGQLQVDSTMIIEIANPDSDLHLHKFMTCQIEDIVQYQMEILGAVNSWVTLDPNDTRWPYHYNERMTSYPATNGKAIDQLEALINKAAKEPHKRSLQAITWVPERDIDSRDPPCLQRIWFFLVPDDKEKNLFWLNMNYHFRSRNVMIAAPINMEGMHILQNYTRDGLKEKGLDVRNGRMVDIIDSYHVSAHDMPLLKGFLKRLKESKKRGETIADRSFGRKTSYSLMIDMADYIKDKLIRETQKIFEERGESRERLQIEIEKIKKIYDGRTKEYGS